LFGLYLTHVRQFGLTVFVLLPFEKYHTNCHRVRHKGKTKHQAYQETNAVDRQIVAVKRIKSDIPAYNEDRNELEIAGTLASDDRQLRNSQAC